VDSLGNVVSYGYAGDPADPAQPQRYLDQIGYADYRDGGGATRFLVQLRLRYEPRPDRITERRGGFPVRTTQRCTRIETWTDPGTPQLVRSVELSYANGSGNGVSLLTRLRVV